MEQKDQVFTSIEIQQLLDRYIETKNHLEMQGSLLHLREKPKLFSAYRQSRHKSDNNSSTLSAPTLFSVCDGCYNGICSVSILPNGDVYPCRRLPIKVGNLLAESFEDILLGNELMRKFRRKDSYEKCGKCDYYFLCRGCSAVTYSLCGDPFAPYPYCFLENCDTERTNVYDVFALSPIKESSNQAEFIYILNSYQNVCLNATEKGNLLRIFKATEEGGWR